jgi:mannose/fructose/N-acetylgalactosamine-specific phosphotransferase system component IID
MVNLTLTQSVALAVGSTVLALTVLGLPPIRVAEILGTCVIGALAAPFVVAKTRVAHNAVRAVIYRRSHGRWPWEK